MAYGKQRRRQCQEDGSTTKQVGEERAQSQQPVGNQEAQESGAGLRGSAKRSPYHREKERGCQEKRGKPQIWRRQEKCPES